MSKKAIFVGPLKDQTFTHSYDEESDTVIVGDPFAISDFNGPNSQLIYKIDSVHGGIAYWFDEYEYPCISAINGYEEAA